MTNLEAIQKLIQDYTIFCDEIEAQVDKHLKELKISFKPQGGTPLKLQSKILMLERTVEQTVYMNKKQS